MALSGRLDADFASFYDACRRATVELKGFDTETKTVEKSLNRMVEEFSGKKIQAEAALMVEAIERIGGVSKLTETELQRVAGTASEAAAKLRATGEAVPEGIGKIAEHATKARTATEALTTSVSRFDNIFSAAGVNIGPVTKGINEIAAVAGKSVSEIGALGTAGLALGSAYAGWQVGRMIADFFNLDEKIAGATARMLGYGDVAAQTAGAKQDVINAAIKNGAAATISYSDAIQFNTDYHKKRLAVVKEAAAADEKHRDAMVELTSVGANWKATLDTMNGAVVEAIKYYLAAGVSQGALATTYGVTDAQVRAVAASIAAEAEVTKQAAEDKKAAEKSLADFRDAAHARQLEIMKIQKTEQAAMTATINQAVIDEMTAKMQLNESHGLDAQGRLKVASAAETLRLKLEDLHKTKQIGIGQAAQEQRLMDEYSKALYDEAVAQDAATAATAKAPAALDQTANATDRATKAAGVYMNQLHMLVDDPKLAAFFGNSAQGAVANTLYGGGANGLTPEMAAAMAAGQFIASAGVGSVQRRAAGGPVSAGAPYFVGERGPELFVPTQGGAIVANHGGGGVTNNVAIYVNGTAVDVARQVASELTRLTMTGTKFGLT